MLNARDAGRLIAAAFLLTVFSRNPVAAAQSLSASARPSLHRTTAFLAPVFFSWVNMEPARLLPNADRRAQGHAREPMGSSGP